MELWLLLTLFALVVDCIILPIVIEWRDTVARYKRAKTITENNLEKYKEIMDMDDNGFCNGCDYGRDRCIKEGRAYCRTLKEVNKDE